MGDTLKQLQTAFIQKYICKSQAPGTEPVSPKSRTWQFVWTVSGNGPCHSHLPGLVLIKLVWIGVIYLLDRIKPNGKVVMNLILALMSQNSSYGDILKMLFS